jgi:hypothetical protein
MFGGIGRSECSAVLYLLCLYMGRRLSVGVGISYPFISRYVLLPVICVHRSSHTVEQ